MKYADLSTWLLAGASLGCLSLALHGVASAQTSPAAVVSSAASPPKAGAEDSALMDVIVTATRREQALKDVPAAITAISPNEIAVSRIENFVDLLERVPGTELITTKGSALTTLQIRGQSTAAQAPGLDPPVAFFQDDLYYGNAASFDTDFFDIAQIAVLKGPQGTTFGRNVVGGALQVTSHPVDMRMNDGQISITGENYTGVEATGDINQAFSDTLAGRLSLSVRERDGYDENVETHKRIDNLNKIGFRAQLRWQPTNNLDASLLLSFLNTNQTGTATKFVGQGAVAANQAAETGNDPWTLYDGEDGFEKRQTGAVALHVNWTIPAGVVQFITGVHTLRQNFAEDVDGLPTPTNYPNYNINDEYVVSQEVRLISHANKIFTYVAGIYGDYEYDRLYFPVDYNITQGSQDDPSDFINLLLDSTVGKTLLPNGAHTPVYSAVEQANTTKTLAPYFEGTLHPTQRLDLIAGVRYTFTDKSGDINHTGLDPFFGGPPYYVNYSRSWYQLTPKFGIDYHVNDNLMLYTTASSGTKSGGFDFSAANAQIALTGLKPEDSWSYEVGLKGQFFNRMLDLNIDAYTAITRNLQVKTISNGAFLETNAGHLTAKGIELQAETHPFRRFDLGLRYAYTDAYFGEFRNCTSSGQDCTDNPAPYTPRHDLLLYAQYLYDLGNSGSLTFNASTHFASRYTTSPNGISAIALVYAQTETPWTTDLSATYAPTSERWSLQAWTKNVTGNHNIVNALNYYFFGLTIPEYLSGLRETDRVMYARPRTYGVTLNYKF